MKHAVTQSTWGPEADFLVIGSGIAGLRAALELCEHGRVLIVTKGSRFQSNSMYAQGGVAVALNAEDNVNLHFSDTIKAGHRLGREDAARVLVEEGPIRIQELIAWGAEFDKVGGQFVFAREGAHSRSRVLRARGDATGHEMTRVLLERARQRPNVQWFDRHFTKDLLVADGRCYGAVVVNETTGAVQILPAAGVLLTTGGVGQIYARTTNTDNATGDGMAMAYRAGAILEDMEFVQFHPTALYLPSSPPFLLSEAMRGEGGVLRNRKGERFLSRYHPAAEMAPRDSVARAIWAEMSASRSRHVYLDVTHLGKTFIRNRFPTIYRTCLRFDIDITEEWIPVSPSAHYVMGGIQAGIDGETSLAGLFAAGEVACTGVHGANRLASNSLLEGLVFGYRAAKSAASLPAGHKRAHVNSLAARVVAGPVSTLDDGEKLRNSLRRLMWEKVGVVRTGESLVQALAQLSRWDVQIQGSLRTRSDLEVKNMIQVARCITEAALGREHSLGAHYREDFPSCKGSIWKTHSQIRLSAPIAFPSTTRRQAG